MTFLGHAANFLSEHQDRDLVIEYLQTLQSLDPGNPKWPTDLGRLYLRETIGAVPSMKSAWAMQALAQFQRAYDLSSWELEQAHLLPSLGKAAFTAGHYDEARPYATEMLDYPKHDITFGDLLHHGPLILGMIALIENDIEQAKYHSCLRPVGPRALRCLVLSARVWTSRCNCFGAVKGGSCWSTLNSARSSGLATS